MHYANITQKQNATYSEALEHLKNGATISRAGWNGKNMYLFLVSGQEIAKRTGYGFGQYEDEPEWSSFIAMKTADNKLIPWLASQTDMLANDWVIKLPAKEENKYTYESLSEEEKKIVCNFVNTLEACLCDTKLDQVQKQNIIDCLLSQTFVLSCAGIPTYIIAHAELRELLDK